MLIFPLIATAVATQGFHAGFDPIPDLSPGQKVRVHVIAAATVPTLSIGRPRSRLGTVNVAGTLIEYRAFEAVVVERKGWIAGIGPRSARTIDWADITRIDTAESRNAWNVVYGAAGGFVGAILLTAATQFAIRPFCDAPPGPGSDCHGFWSTTKRIAVYSVPLGAAVGYFATHWKAVYWRQRPQV